MSDHTRDEKRDKTDLEHQAYLEALRKAKANSLNVPSISDKFADSKSAIDQIMNESTAGRHSLNDYRRKRERIQREMSRVIQPVEEKKKAIPPPPKGRLSFNNDESSEEDDQPSPNKKQKTEFRKRKLGKDPNVDTSFLPDREREEQEEREKELASLEWLDAQERIKGEILKVDYCYYDGTTHSKSYSVKKGTLIKSFVEEAKLNFSELKGVTTDQLLFVKECFIIPHSITFYDLMEMPAPDRPALVDWGMSGTKPSSYQLGEMSRLAKIVSKDFYERNKHNYPLNEWKPYKVK